MARDPLPLSFSTLICLVTDRTALTEPATAAGAWALPQLLEVIADCADAGVDLVQIREPDLDDRSLLGLVRGAVDRTRATSAHVVVNDRPDVALAAGADGVHLKDDERSVPRVRALGPRDWIVGRSVHDTPAARRAAQSRAVDYLLAGTVFVSASKPGRRPLGLDALREIVRASSRPVLAIGGVTMKNAAYVAETGAAGVAGIRLFRCGPTGQRRAWIAERVQALRAAFDRRETLD